MNAKKHFQKHYAKLNTEAVLMSLLRGLIIGLICGFTAAFITWFTLGSIEQTLVRVLLSVFIPVGTMILVTAIASLLFYFLKYRPTEKGNAKRLDSLGMNERMITMLELEGDNSTIARLQREDAKRHLNSIPSSAIKIAIPLVVTILICVFAPLMSGMTVVSGLAAGGIIKPGDELFEDTTEELAPDVYFSVTYEVEEGGYIEGEADQLVLAGGNAEPVTAVAEEGYIFVEWDDGSTRPGRQDKKITEDLIFYAVFEPISDEGDGEPSDDDRPNDNPQESEDATQSSPGSDSNDASGGPGGKYEEVNQIIDGKTYYREVLESYRELLRQRLESEGDSLTDEERAIIESYLGIV